MFPSLQTKFPTKILLATRIYHVVQFFDGRPEEYYQVFQTTSQSEAITQRNNLSANNPQHIYKIYYESVLKTVESL